MYTPAKPIKRGLKFMHLTYAYNNETVNFREFFGLVKSACGHLFVYHQSDQISNGEMNITMLKC